MDRREDLSLLERTDELTSLEEALAASPAGQGRVVRIEGSAGIGKSRLLGAAAAMGRARGLVLLEAAGSELERGSPFAISSTTSCSWLAAV